MGFFFVVFICGNIHTAHASSFVQTKMHPATVKPSSSEVASDSFNGPFGVTQHDGEIHERSQEVQETTLTDGKNTQQVRTSRVCVDGDCKENVQRANSAPNGSFIHHPRAPVLDSSQAAAMALHPHASSASHAINAMEKAMEKSVAGIMKSMDADFENLDKNFETISKSVHTSNPSKSNLHYLAELPNMPKQGQVEGVSESTENVYSYSNVNGDETIHRVATRCKNGDCVTVHEDKLPNDARANRNNAKNGPASASGDSRRHHGSGEPAH